MFRLGTHSSHSSSMASTAFLEFCHVWFCFLSDVIQFGVVDRELSISRAKGTALIWGIHCRVLRRKPLEEKAKNLLKDFLFVAGILLRLVLFS